MTINPQARQQAANRYRQSGWQGLDERALMAEAFHVLIASLYLSRDAHTNRLYDQMCQHNAKIIKIVSVLRAQLMHGGPLEDADAAGSARLLIGIYTQLIERLCNILQHPSPEQEFAALVEMLLPIYRAWQSAPPTGDPTAAPVDRI